MEDDDEEEDLVPKPMVLIDQDADPEATIVQLSFGDRLGALIDTVSDSHPQVSFRYTFYMLHQQC